MRPACRSINGSTGSPRRGPAGSDGLVITPYFLGEKTPIHDANARATFDGLTLSHDIGHLWRALARGLRLCDRPSRRGHERDRLQDGALHRLRRRFDEPRLDADRRRRPATPASAARRPSRLLRRRRVDGRDRRRALRPTGRGSPPLSARPTGSSLGAEAADIYRQGYRRYRDLYSRLAERSELAAP